MRLPSSSSLLLASLASSSSLPALAAPSGDRPEDSSSVSLRSDDTTAQPNNHLQGRVDLTPLKQIFDAIGNVLASPSKGRAENSPRSVVDETLQGVIGKRPIQMATRAEESGADSPSQNESASQALPPPAPAGPGNAPKPPAAPVNNLPLPIPLPVNPSLPQIPGTLPVKTPGRRDLAQTVGNVVSGVVKNPITPVQRELTPDDVGQ